MPGMVCGPYLLDPYRRFKSLYLKCTHGIAVSMMIHGRNVNLTNRPGYKSFNVPPGTITQKNISRAVATGIITKRPVMDHQHITQCIFIGPCFFISAIDNRKMFTYLLIFSCPD